MSAVDASERVVDAASMQHAEEEGASATVVESALHSNIKTKGQNSYYYAHKKREDNEVHEWDGHAAPRLLKKEELDRASFEDVQSITTYGWADGKKRVSIYVTLEGIHEHPEELIEVNWTATSLELRVRQYQGKTRVLALKLYDEISDVTTKRKEDRLVLLLKKAKEFSWYSLKKDSK